MRTFDRLTRQWIDRVPTSALSSQLIVEGPLSLDRAFLSGGELLVDNDDGTAVIEADRERSECRLRQSGNRDSMRATLTIAAHIDELLAAGFDAADIVGDVDPLVRIRDVEQLLERDR